MLRKHYLKTKAWRYDLASLLPTDIAYYWWKPGTCDHVGTSLSQYFFPIIISIIAWGYPLLEASIHFLHCFRSNLSMFIAPK